MYRKTETLTGRAARRYNERQDRMEAKRREAADKLAAWRAMTPEEKARHKKTQEAVDRIQRNGITLEDMELQYKLGREDGFKQGAEQTFETLFAAIALALNELHGFDAEQCAEVLNLTHEKVFYALSREDAIQEVYDTLGLTINFNDTLPGNMIETKEDGGEA